jgi:serine/threonine protein kinase
MIAFLCSGCGKSLKVKDEFAGRKGKCPHCQQPMTVPSTADAARERSEAAGHDTYSETDAKTILPSSFDGDRDSKTILPAVPRGNPGPKKSNTLVPGATTGFRGNAELYDFLAPPQAADEIGRLGSYRVLKVLGAGGMGVVFQAEDPKLHRLVALKAMLPALAASGTNKERFMLEARAAAQIEHDHIVAIFQVEEDRGVPFIAMPFLRGESLEERLKKQRKLPLDEALRIAKETAEGLAAAHDRNMIHRDIKPANIWLEGERGRVKILDFGLARSARGDSKLTQQGTIIGTPQYMAPEQGAGKPVDTRCDLFSLGCVLYRITTGQLPFKGTDTVSTLVAVATETPKAPRKLNPNISPRLSKLIMDLLAKDPKDRPPSALSVVDLIDELEKEPAADQTQAIDDDEPAVRVRVVREDEDDTVHAVARRAEEEEPAKRSLMLPLLIGGGVGVVGLLLIGIIAVIVLVKSNDKPDVAKKDNPPIDNTPINISRPNENKVPIANPKRDPIRNPNRNDPLRNPGGNDPIRNPNASNNNPDDKNPGGDDPIQPRPRPRRKPKKDEKEADKTYKPYNSAVKGLAFAPDGKHFFGFGERNTRMDYWDAENGKTVQSYELGSAVHAFVTSPDGSRLLAYNEGRLRAWDVDGGQPLAEVIAPPGTRIVGGGFIGDKDIRAALAVKGPLGSAVIIYESAKRSLIPILDPKTGKPLMDKRTKQVVPLQFPHQAEVERVFFGPDCKRFISWSKDHMFRTWDVEEKRLATTFTVAPDQAKSISMSTDFKKILASFPQAGVRVYDVDAGTEAKDFKPDGVGDTDAVAFGGDNNLGVTATFGGPTRVYDLEEAKIKQTVKGIAFTSAIALSPDGKTILCGDIGGKIYLFNLNE